MNPSGYVYVIDDDAVLCDSIGQLLNFAGYAARTWTDARSFLAELPNTVPAVVVTDVRMPNIDGLALHEALLERGRRMPVIYISGASTVEQGIRAMKMGAVDFLVKPFTRETLLTAVAAGIEKDRQAMQQIIARARFDESLKSLSPRQREVHGLLLKGFNNEEIVEHLSVSLHTAKQYKSEVMRKLGVRSLAELIRLSVPV